MQTQAKFQCDYLLTYLLVETRILNIRLLNCQNALSQLGDQISQFSSSSRAPSLAWLVSLAKPHPDVSYQKAITLSKQLVFQL